MALFSQYAVAAAEEALEDSGWGPRSDEEQERTVRSTSQHQLLVKGCENRRTDTWGQGVCIGSGIGSLVDAYQTSVNYSEGVSLKANPRILLIPVSNTLFSTGL